MKQILIIAAMEGIGLAITCWIVFPSAFHWVLRVFGALLFVGGFYALIHAWGAEGVLRAGLVLLLAGALFIWKKGKTGIRWLTIALLAVIAVMEGVDLLFHLGGLVALAFDARPSPPSRWVVLAGFFALSVPALLLALGWEKKSSPSHTSTRSS